MNTNTNITPANGNTTPNNPNITLTTHYLIKCKALGIHRTFTDQDTAHTFATQLEQDYPQAKIERFKCVGWFDSWNDCGTDENTSGTPTERLGTPQGTDENANGTDGIITAYDNKTRGQA